MDIEDFVRRYPSLYHMAEIGTWPSIEKHGLLSTSASLDRLGIKGSARVRFERAHRGEKVALRSDGFEVVLRDQKPMPPARIAKALTDGTTPEQWYRFLNGKVFLWAEEHRLLGLLSARPYRHLVHDVLTLDTNRLVDAYLNRISVCRMNSGNTFPYWHSRGRNDFMSIAAYPVTATGAPFKPVVEVVVEYAIPDVAKFVTRVRKMKGGDEVSNLAG
jgi:hypothetical protein